MTRNNSKYIFRNNSGQFEISPENKEFILWKEKHLNHRKKGILIKENQNGFILLNGLIYGLEGQQGLKSIVNHGH